MASCSQINAKHLEEFIDPNFVIINHYLCQWNQLTRLRSKITQKKMELMNKNARSIKKSWALEKKQCLVLMFKWLTNDKYVSEFLYLKKMPNNKVNRNQIFITLAVLRRSKRITRPSAWATQLRSGGGLLATLCPFDQLGNRTQDFPHW